MDEFTKAVSDLKVCLKTMDQIPLDLGENSCVRVQRPKSDRFLVNLYEWPLNCIEEKKRRSLKLRTVDNNVGKQVTHKSDHLKKKLAMDQFIQLKTRRDIECLKIKEASKALKYLNECSLYGLWLERLLAEKVLLRSGKAVELLTNKIREEYVQIGPPQVQIATISTSNIQFQIEHVRKSNQTDFFVLLLTNDLDVKTSKFERATGGQIQFDETFTFQVHRDFRIKLQLCAISMKETPKYFALTKFLQCHKINNTSSKLQYKNPNTSDFEESEVLKTSFRPIAETEITASSLHNTAWKLNKVQDFALSDYVHLSTRVESFKISNHKSGFLTLGLSGFWKRQWCVLDDHFVQIYNSPDEENDPVKVLDLVKCRKIGLASEGLCSRPRTFFVEMFDEMCFFMADNSADLRVWLTEIELVLDLLRFRNSHKLYQSL